MKIMKLTLAVIALSSLSVLTFGSLECLEQSKPTIPYTIIEEDNKLLKKWNLSHYELFGFDFDPETNEKNDYVYFGKDGIYYSISEGVFDEGNYTFDKKTIIMTNSTEEGKLKLLIKSLTETSLSVSIDDPDDIDAQYLTIHFKNMEL